MKDKIKEAKQLEKLCKNKVEEKEGRERRQYKLKKRIVRKRG